MVTASRIPPGDDSRKTPHRAISASSDTSSTPATEHAAQVAAQATQPAPNQFEHFCSNSEKGPIGAKGSHAETAIRLQDVVRVGALVFDVDVKQLAADVVPVLRKYLADVLPQLELRSTSSAGNLHAILHFRNAVGLDFARKLWEPLRRLLFSDSSAGILMKARAVGSQKLKDTGETHLVSLVQAGSRISAKDLLTDLTDIPVDSTGNQAGAAGWKRRQFGAIMTLLTAPDGRPLWDGIGTHGLCPLHGSGANPKQCAVRPDYASCSCFGDCSDGDGHPKAIGLAEILEKRVFTSSAWPDFQKYYVDAPATANGRPVVVHNPFQPLFMYYVAVLEQFARTNRYFRYGNHIAEIRGDRINPITEPMALVGAVTGFMEIAVVEEGGRKFKRFGREDAAAILYAEPVLATLPEIEVFTEIPVLDMDLRLVPSGYDPSSRVYCASETIAPALAPKYLPAFLAVIDFREPASRDNYVGVLLTSFLILHFRGEKPLAVFDANQQQVGKTTLAKCAAAVGTNGPVGTLTYNPDDEEFEKTLASHVLRGNFIIVDNAKTRKTGEVSSATLERSVTDAWLSYRRLGFNKLIERPNDVLWMVTMNDARLSPDLTDRGVPIRLHYEGDPKRRQSPVGDPKQFFLEHLPEIRAELLGMIMNWDAAGRPEVECPFRFRKWARWIGGILAVNGFTEFLRNVDESRVEFDPILSALRTIAEQWPDQFKKASEWLQTIRPDGLLASVWSTAATERVQASALGKLFRSYQQHSFEITLPDGSQATATLMQRHVHSGVEWAFTTNHPGGERGGRPNEGSPPRSPSQVAAQQDVTEAGERGERERGPCSNGASQLAPRGGGGPHVVSHAMWADRADQSATCGGRCPRVDSHATPEFRSPRSPDHTKLDVTSCVDNDLAAVNARVNVIVNVAGIHPEIPPPSPSAAESPLSGGTPGDRNSRLAELHEQHPAPDPAPAATTIPVTTGTTQLGGEDLIYEIRWDQRPFGPRIIAFDTETTVITDPAAVPEFVLATASDGERHVVMGADEVADFLAAHAGHALVFHNVAFDFWVLQSHFAAVGREDAGRALWTMAQNNQFRDTMLLDQLVALARTGAQPAMRDLGTVAAEFADLHIDKSDPYRMRYAEIRGVPLNDVDQGFLDYAVKDAVATIHAYAGLVDAARRLMKEHVNLYDPNLAAKYGLLTEAIQVQAAIALAVLSRNGMHVDVGRLQNLRQNLEQKRDGLIRDVEEAVQADADLVAAGAGSDGIYQRDGSRGFQLTQAGAPRVSTKRLMQVLEAVVKVIEQRDHCRIDIPRTPRSGALSEKAADWEPFRNRHAVIDRWLRLNELVKLLQFTTSTAAVLHPRYTVLVRTGRTSCSGPNIQQLPRDGGVRECLIASPGHVLLAIDYSYIELRTLAAVCESRYRLSRLADVIRDGVDPHCHTAALIRKTPLQDFMSLERTAPKAYKADRQRAKAVNFGVPGGLGANALVAYAASTYGVKMPLEDATRLRDALIGKVYPELTQYLDENLMAALAGGLGVNEEDCWAAFDERGERPEWLPRAIRNVVRGQTHKRNGQAYDPDWFNRIWETLTHLNRRIELGETLAAQKGSDQLGLQLFGRNSVATLTGRIRANVSYTEARNTPFQGLAADGAKLAMFRLVAAGYRVVAFVHDEFLIELPVNTDHAAAARSITQIMCAAMQEVTGQVPIACGEPVLMHQWSKEATAVHDDQGRLVVWTPEE